MPVVDLSHPLEQISERGLLPKRPFPGPADLPLVGGAFYFQGPANGRRYPYASGTLSSAGFA
jgi:hypothetical protein